MESFWPYLAGFFDSGGSLHFQIVRQSESPLGFYIRVSLVFYQATQAEYGLHVIRERIEAGRLRRRTGGMSDLTLTNRHTIRRILDEMERFVIFKQRQVALGLELIDRLPPPRDPQGFLAVWQTVDDFASLNFSKARAVTADTVRRTFEEARVHRSP